METRGMADGSEVDFRDLLARARAGEEQAATELVRRYEPELRRFIRFRLTNWRLRRHVDSVDICQSVLGRFFIGLFAGRFKFQSGQQLSALLTRMAKNEVLDLVRRQKTVRHGGLECHEFPDQTASWPGLAGVSAVEQLADRERIQMILQELSAEDRALVERRLEGCGWAELAAAFHSSAEAVRKRFTRAIQRAVAQTKMQESEV